MSRSAIPITTEQDWQTQLRQAISCSHELLEYLGLRADNTVLSNEAIPGFPVKVPHSFARRMQQGNIDDPLLRQVLATSQELVSPAAYTPDPVDETGTANPLPGVIQKYHGRALLIVAGGCAVNCRYCFRRHFPYGDNLNARRDWGKALQYIANDPSISEVILSGGDPLVATDSHLHELVTQIGAISHVKRLRVHTRLPVVIPQRVTPTLLNAITHKALQTVVVLHCNHAQEINSELRDAAQQLRDRDITILNQAVLLGGVNDSVQAQVELNEALFAAGILPYYLHLLDKVAGAAHFDIPESEAQKIHAGTIARLPGYMVPRLVREIAGASSKVGLSL